MHRLVAEARSDNCSDDEGALAGRDSDINKLVCPTDAGPPGFCVVLPASGRYSPQLGPDAHPVGALFCLTEPQISDKVLASPSG